MKMIIFIQLIFKNEFENDTTTLNKELPKTGETNIRIMIGIITVIAIGSFGFMKYYKNK